MERTPFFWTDRWLHGQYIADLAPRLFAVIPKRRTKQRTIQDALTNQTWISDIKGARTVGVIVDYLLLWDVLSDFLLQPNVEDRHIWWFSSDGQYSARTAYKVLFVGSTSFEPCERIWKTWALPKCCFFVWLVAHNRFGQQIALHVVGSLILSTALCVIRLQKLLITS
jgi:hypothetical protein